jgi:autotransporter-associated beta strand protein
MKNIIIVGIVSLLCLGGTAGADVIDSISDGNWNSSGTWTGGDIPAAADTGVVLHNVEVTGAGDLSGSTAAAQVNSGGRLFVDGLDYAFQASGGGDHTTLTLNGGEVEVDNNDNSNTGERLGGNFVVDATSTIDVVNGSDSGDTSNPYYFNNLTFSGNGSTLTVSSSAINSNEFQVRFSDITLAGGDEMSIGDAVSVELQTASLASGTFSLSGSGTAVLQGDNASLAGTLDVTGATINAEAATAGNDELGSADFTLNAGATLIGQHRNGDTKFTDNIITLNGGTLQYNLRDNSGDNGSAEGTVNVAASSTLSTANFQDNAEAQGDTVTYDVLNFTGAGTTLTVDNPTSGGGGVTTARFGEANIDYDATLDIKSNTWLIFDLLDGAGTLSKTGVGLLRIVAPDTTNSWTGAFEVDAGTVDVVDDIEFATLKVDGSYVSPGSYSTGELNHFTGGGQITVNAIPEPATMGLLAIGGIGLVLRRRRKA